MTAVAAPPDAEPLPEYLPVRTRGDRLLSAVPLLSVYFWLCILYVYQAWGRVTPWLFSDELERTQLARAVAQTGHAARRGVAHSPDGVYTYLIAPAWWLGNTQSSYDAVKYIGVFVMASALFPTYFLARMLVGRWWALFAATGTAAAPSVAYASWIIQEPLAYPYAALCFFVLAKALANRRRSWAVAAVIVCGFAPAVRGELIIFPLILVFAVGFMAWSSTRLRARRADWTSGDWLGFVTLAFGAIFLLSGYLSYHIHEFYVTTYKYKHRMFSLGLWATGAFAIGIGVIPMIGGLTSLVRTRREEPQRELRVFRCVALAGLLWIGFYTYMKAAYLSTVFETRVEERNIIYIAPLLFVGTAIILQRRRANLVALAGATAFGAYLMVTTPYKMGGKTGVQLYSDALGLAILQQANRFLFWTPQIAQWVMLAVTIAGGALLGAVPLLRERGRQATIVAAAVAALAVGWNLTAEIAAATGDNSVSRSAAATLGKPYDWVDRIAKGKPTIYLGQAIFDPNAEHLMEFWNKSIVTVGSTDGTVGGPGPAGGPNIAADGRTYWTLDPNHPGREYDYAVEEWPCIDFAGAFEQAHSYLPGGNWRLIRLTHPNRLQAECVGISPDGWTGPNNSGYFRFSGGAGGHLVVTISRKDGGPTTPTPIHILLGTLTVDANHQPRFGKVLEQKDDSIAWPNTKTFTLAAPSARFAVRVVIDDLFSPHDLNPSDGDVRQLGAGVTYRFVPAGQAAHT